MNATDDIEPRARAIHPVGDLNSLEIDSREGAVIATVNGVAVDTSEAGEPRGGTNGVQSGSAGIHFRNLRTMELP